ncbi:hypothetical protein ACVOMT_03925 [Sphingomonas panni]
MGNPWAAGATTGLAHGDTVLLIGTGLTMVDVALTLEAQGFAGRIVALSRRGLLPHRHAPATPAAQPLRERPRPPLSALVRTVRARGRRSGGVAPLMSYVRLPREYGLRPSRASVAASCAICGHGGISIATAWPPPLPTGSSRWWRAGG